MNRYIPKIIQFILISVCFAVIYAEEICDMRLTDCPEDFHNSTIIVPKKVTSLSSNFFVCIPQDFIESGNINNVPPSIMFVIDHSGSMSGISGNNSPTDTAGSRFAVTRALIDTILNKYPKAEVGLVIFQSVLFIDTRNQEFAVPLPNDYAHPYGYKTQGYIPLLKLDSTLSNGQKVADMLKGLLQTKKVSLSSSRTTTDLVYKPNFNTDGYTNINTAFDAAKFAMQSAKNPKEHQFIIFLSDGEPMPKTNRPDYHGNKDYNNFINGTNVPTTFTVYFVSQGNSIPKSISDMTANIRNNNYSTNNPSSDVWGIQTSFGTLLDVLMGKVINPIFSLIRKVPTKLTINNVTYNQYNIRDSSFLIPNIKLQDSTTKLDIRINYKVRKDTSSQAFDSIANISFNILRSDLLPASNGVLITCYDDTCQVSISATKNASEEGQTNGTFKFTRTDSKQGNLTVYFTVTGTATPGKDYVSIPDSIVFTGNQTSLSCTIKPVVDSLTEGNETIIISILTQKPGREIGYKISSQSKATVTISDNLINKTSPDTIKISVAPNPLSLREGSVLINSLGNSKSSYENLIKSKTNGMLISVLSSRRLETLHNDPGHYGKAVIYDATGNIVKKFFLIKANNKDSTLYGFVWDGTNTHDRFVSGGIYLMKIICKNKGGISSVFTKKVGIRF